MWSIRHYGNHHLFSIYLCLHYASSFSFITALLFLAYRVQKNVVMDASIRYTLQYMETFQPDGGHVGFTRLLWLPGVQFIIKQSCFFHCTQCVLAIVSVLYLQCTYNPSKTTSHCIGARPSAAILEMAARHRCSTGPQADKLFLVGGPQGYPVHIVCLTPPAPQVDGWRSSYDALYPTYEHGQSYSLANRKSGCYQRYQRIPGNKLS